MKTLLKSVILACGFSAMAAAPDYQWDFEKWQGKNPQGKGDLIHTVKAEKEGFKNSIGIKMQETKYPAQVVSMTDTAKLKEITVELKFKLSEPIDAKYGNVLLTIAKNSWDRGLMTLKITGKSELEFRFHNYEAIPNTKKTKDVNALVLSKALKFVPGKYYTVRAASKSGGAMKIWLDNELVASREQGGMCFCDMKTNVPKWYPLLRLGVDQRDPNPKINQCFFKGYFDDVKIWKTFAEPDAASIAENSETKEHILLSEKVYTTRSFFLPDRPGKALGSFVKPEQRFIDAASTVSLQLTGQNLAVTFNSPIPKGLTLQKSDHCWVGDNVEVFIRPDLKKDNYFHYTVNAKGVQAFMAYTNGALNKNFKSAAKVQMQETPELWKVAFTVPLEELKLDKAPEGHIFSMNFCRYGKTSGGVSQWALTGSNFHTLKAFGLAVLKSRKQALQNVFAETKTEFNSIKAPAALKKDIAEQFDALSAEIGKNGDKAENFDLLNSKIKAMALKLVQLRFAGTSAMLWTPQNPWGNTDQISSIAKKTEKIKITMAQNTFTARSIMFSNLTSKPFLAQIKAFDIADKKKNTIYNSFNSKHYSRSQFVKNIKLFRAMPVELSAGIFSNDAIVPLEMGTLLEAAPNETKQLWLKISSQNLAPGTYRAVLFMKPSYAGFKTQEIEIELEVKPVDLGKIFLNSFHYTYLQQRECFGEAMDFFAATGTNVVYPGCLGQNNPVNNIYPQVDKQGNVIKFSDYAGIDKIIDGLTGRGIPLNKIMILYFCELHSYGLNLHGKPQLAKFSPEWKKAMKAFLKHFTDHFKTKYGIDKKRIIFYTVDEPEGDINNPKSRMGRAYAEGKFIKECDKDYVTLVNPHPNVIKSLAKNSANLNKLTEYYDIFELYRPALTPELIKWAQGTGKEIWTYGIYGKSVTPDIYRREYWSSFRDGFTEFIAYWHLDSHAGNDGFNAEDGISNRVDYGSIYSDFDLEKVIMSRREAAHQLGKEDFRLAKFCREELKKKPDASLSKELEKIVREAVESDCDGMESAREKLLKLAEKIKK